MTTLNDLMEFDHVVFIDENGHVHDHNTLTPTRAGWSRGVTASTHLYAPELCDDSIGDPLPENASESLAGVGTGESVGEDVQELPRPRREPVRAYRDEWLQEQAQSAGWDGLLQGFTGQYSYNGPVMHESEYVGGGLERYILSNPGWYCVTAVNAPDEDGTYSGEVSGWAIAYKEAREWDGPWVDVVFIDDLWIRGISEKGTEELVEHLSQWDYGQETEDAHTRDAYPWGSNDRTYLINGYVLAINYQLGYASLNRRPMGSTVTR